MKNVFICVLCLLTSLGAMAGETISVASANELSTAINKANVTTEELVIKLSGAITPMSQLVFSNKSSSSPIKIVGPATIKTQPIVISVGTSLRFENLTIEGLVTVYAGDVTFANCVLSQEVVKNGGSVTLTNDNPDATTFPSETVICASGQRQVYFGWPTLKGVTKVNAEIFLEKSGWSALPESDLIRRNESSAEPTITGWQSIRYINASRNSTAQYRLVATTENGSTFESQAVSVTTAAAGTLHSRPGAKATIYLDFDGYVDDYYGNASAANRKYIAAPIFPNREAIRAIWRSVAEDYYAFDVDVTTEEPELDRLIKSTAEDENYGKRVVFSGNDKWYPNAGGISGAGAFGFRTDRPAFIFGEITDNIACQATHEIAHTLGLSHDGGEIIVPKGSEIYEDGKWITVEEPYTISSAYYSGQRVSLNCTWYPVMGGVPTSNGSDYINQFSNGNYKSSTNKEEDLWILTGRATGFKESSVVNFPATLYPDGKETGFWKLTPIADDVGELTSQAQPYTDVVYGVIGINEASADVDAYKFYAKKDELITVRVWPEFEGSSYGCSLDAYIKVKYEKPSTPYTSNKPLQGDVGDGEFRKAEVQFTAPFDGNYYAYVSGGYHEVEGNATSGYGSIGPYKLKIVVGDEEESREGDTTKTEYYDCFMNEHWSQTSPYNQLLPAYLPQGAEDGEYQSRWKGHVTAGCVATQMAQVMHYWGWPRQFNAAINGSHSVNIDGSKTQFSVEQTISAAAPIFGSVPVSNTRRLTFIAATLGVPTFARDGSGGYPDHVRSALEPYYVNPPTCTDDDLKNYLKLGYPVPATITGHAIVLCGYRRDSDGVEWYWQNNGQGGSGDAWIRRSAIKTLNPMFPKRMVQIKNLPKRVKLPLTINWDFPELYMTIYKTAFQGFKLSVNDGSPISVGRENRSYTFSSLPEGEVTIKVTPVFGELAEDDPTVFITPSTTAITITVDASAPDAPTLEEPELKKNPDTHLVALPLSGSAFRVKGSESLKSLNVIPSLKSYTINGVTHTLPISVEGSNGDFVVRIGEIDFLDKSDSYNVLLTLEGVDANGSTVYQEVAVNFSAANATLPEIDPLPTPEEMPENVVHVDNDNPIYVLISPSSFVSDWTNYVIARARAHTNLTFAVKNAADIYKDYGDKGGSPTDMIKSYIAQQAAKGTQYFVLGAAWSDILTMDGKSEESFVVPGENGDKYATLALSLDNTIPGFTRTFGGKTLATDYPYVLVDGDEKPDVVVARIPLVPWPKADGSIATFTEIIKGYGKKVTAVEDAAFLGTHRYACAGAQLGATVARGSEYWPTERHHYADGYYDFFDSRHPDSATDGMIAARRRFRDFFAMYNPVKGAMVIPLGNAATDFFDDKSGWEALIAKCHGLEDAAYQTGITDARFRETSTLVKFGIFAMPCLTGRPDRTTTWGGWSNLRYPSMGVAAICNPTGGEVVGFHNTHDGAGENKVELVTTNRDAYATQYEGFLLTRLCKEHKNAGLAWKAAHEDYIDKHGTGTWHLWTAYESLLYGDPLVEMSAVNEPVCGPGTLPAKVLFR